MRLFDRVRRGSPDTAEAGDDIERFVAPRKRRHVAHPYVGLGVAIARNRHESRRGVDPGAGRTAGPGELDGEAGTARGIEKQGAVGDPEPVVHGHVLA